MSAYVSQPYSERLDQLIEDGVRTADLLVALANSPALGGTPTAPTASTGTNTTQIATTEFIQQAINEALSSLLVAGSNINLSYDSELRRWTISSTASASTWVIASGMWSDSGIWDDNATWSDS